MIPTGTPKKRKIGRGFSYGKMFHHDLHISPSTVHNVIKKTQGIRRNFYKVKTKVQ